MLLNVVICTIFLHATLSKAAGVSFKLTKHTQQWYQPSQLPLRKPQNIFPKVLNKLKRMKKSAFLGASKARLPLTSTVACP